MPQRFQAAQAGLGYRMPLHKQMISKLSVHFTVAGFLFATLGSSRAQYAVLVWPVPGAYTIMPTGVDARARKCL